MGKTKKMTVISLISVLFIGVMAGFFMARGSFFAARADEEESVKADLETLEELYDASFGRPLDEEGRKFHLGRDLKQVLRDINNSQEKRYYSALFKAVKAYEEAIRDPGELSVEDKQRHLNNIDSALSTLLAWVETLPERNICKAVIGAVEAREAIQRAYEQMSPQAKAAAEKGIFNALKHIGPPKDLDLPVFRCLASPSPLPPSTPTPTPTSTAAPTPTPESTPTPTPEQ